MKTTYEKFSELADVMTKGEGRLHRNNCAENHPNPLFGEGDCLSWQAGVQDFAEWLDYLGVKVTVSDNKKGFYDFQASRHKEID